MKKNKNIGINILIASLTLSGIMSITTGTILNKKNNVLKTDKIQVEVIQKQVAKIKSNIPKLKEITIEINEPLSVNIIDYIENMDDIEDSVLKPNCAFKLSKSRCPFCIETIHPISPCSLCKTNVGADFSTGYIPSASIADNIGLSCCIIS